MVGQVKWVGTWAAAPRLAEQEHARKVRMGDAEMTIRETVRISQGGPEFRIALTNEYGADALAITEVHVAVQREGASVDPATDRTVSFGGKTTISVQEGRFVVSDPIKLTLSSMAKLTITLLIPQQKIDSLTFHGTAVASTYLVPGNHVKDTNLEPAETTHSWYFLKDVEVSAGKNNAAVVALGDSITDGSFSEADANHRWPDRLSERLIENEKTRRLSVLNEGIGGNRLLHENIGESALNRLDRDVLSAPGVRYVVLLEGINDIGFSEKPRSAEDVISTAQLLDAMKRIVKRTHARRLKIFGATLTPFVGARYATVQGEAMRQEVNQFIRSSGLFDGVIDFEKAVRDPMHPDRLLPEYDSGDHLHPSDAGYRAMGDAVDLHLFDE
jgi:lysophospholipase L1-like esterase